MVEGLDPYDPAGENAMESTSEKRVMGRLAARELTEEELREVSGGQAQGACFGHGGYTTCATVDWNTGWTDVEYD